MIRLTIGIVTLGLLGLAVGCSSATKAPAVAPTRDGRETAAPSKSSEDNPSQAQISISDEIKRACGLSDEDAYFAFDSTRIRARDHQILGKVARCFRDGPLSGRRMKLVGHADPRGEQEYNMALGGRRADNVKAFMVTEGLPAPRMTSTSRGAMDATGTEESSWAKDRRVDILLGG